MKRAFIGAALAIAGIAGFIEAHAHHPVPLTVGGLREWGPGAPSTSEYDAAISHTAYDLLRIGAWALVIFGALLVVMGLIAYWGAQTGPDARP